MVEVDDRWRFLRLERATKKSKIEMTGWQFRKLSQRHRGNDGERETSGTRDGSCKAVAELPLQ